MSSILEYTVPVLATCALPLVVYHNRASSLFLLSLSVLLLSLSPLLLPAGTNTLLVQTCACIGSTWSFKIAALSLKRGVLQRELDRGCSVWRFAGVLLLPVIPGYSKQARSSRANAAVKLVTGSVKAVIFTLLLSSYLEPAIALTSHQLHFLPRLISWAALFYAFGLCLWLEVSGAGDLMDVIAIACFGIQPEPHFNMPPLATSFAELWARRWNLTVSSLLRDLIYQPLVEASLLPPGNPDVSRHDSASSLADGCPANGTKAPTDAKQVGPSRTRRLLGLTATFAFSGLWHEIVYSQMAYSPATGTIVTTRGLWTLFFLCQVPAIALEGQLLRSTRLPQSWLHVLATNLIFIALIGLFWMPPLFFELPPLQTSSTCEPSDLLAGGALSSDSMLGRLISQTRADRAAMARLIG